MADLERTNHRSQRRLVVVAAMALRILAVILVLLGALAFAAAATCREGGGALDVDLFTCESIRQGLVGAGSVLLAGAGVSVWASFWLKRPRTKPRRGGSRP